MLLQFKHFFYLLFKTIFQYHTKAVNSNHYNPPPPLYEEGRSNHHSMKMLPEVTNKERKQQTGVALPQWPPFRGVNTENKV